MIPVKFKPANHFMKDVFFPRQFQSLSEQFFGDQSENAANSGVFFRPLSDISETEKSFEIHMALPGLNKEEIKIDVKNDELRVSGERMLKNASKTSTYHLSEITQGQFSRTFYLPENVLSDKIEATYENGILLIAIPKGEQLKPKSISVK
jgi:HSP20 family protein